MILFGEIFFETFGSKYFNQQFIGLFESLHVIYRFAPAVFML